MVLLRVSSWRWCAAVIRCAVLSALIDALRLVGLGGHRRDR